MELCKGLRSTCDKTQKCSDLVSIGGIMAAVDSMVKTVSECSNGK